MHKELSIIQRITRRSSTSDDVENLFSLEKENMEDIVAQFYPGRWSDEEFREKIIENLERTVIFELDNEIVGHFYWYPTELPNSVWLGSLQLKPDYQGKGIGKWMMEIFENTICARGYRTVYLTVFNDTPAKRMYEKMGYDEHKSDGDHAVEMKKELPL